MKQIPPGPETFSKPLNWVRSKFVKMLKAVNVVSKDSSGQHAHGRLCWMTSLKRLLAFHFTGPVCSINTQLSPGPEIRGHQSILVTKDNVLDRARIHFGSRCHYHARWLIDKLLAPGDCVLELHGHVWTKWKISIGWIRHRFRDQPSQTIHPTSSFNTLHYNLHTLELEENLK